MLKSCTPPKPSFAQLVCTYILYMLGFYNVDDGHMIVT